MGTEPIHLPLSALQWERLDRLAAEARAIVDRRNEALAFIIAGAVDPETIGAWTIDVTPAGVTLTPPSDGSMTS